MRKDDDFKQTVETPCGTIILTYGNATHAKPSDGFVPTIIARFDGQNFKPFVIDELKVELFTKCKVDLYDEHKYSLSAFVINILDGVMYDSLKHNFDRQVANVYGDLYSKVIKKIVAILDEVL